MRDKVRVDLNLSSVDYQSVIFYIKLHITFVKFNVDVMVEFRCFLRDLYLAYLLKVLFLLHVFTLLLVLCFILLFVCLFYFYCYTKLINNYVQYCMEYMNINRDIHI